MKRQLLFLISFTSVVISPVIAFSEEKDNWQFELAPFYLWAINIDGDFGLRGKTTSTNIDFNDVWGNLQGVLTVRFNALYHRKIGLFFDYNYLNLETKPVTRTGATEVGFTSQILNLAGTYRFMEGRHTVDGLAGIRYNKMDADVNFNLVGITLDGDQNWVDPIIGLRYEYSLSDKWALRLYGDIGGFGVSSDFTWQAIFQIHYQPWENVSLVGGFRALGIDYESGSSEEFSYDTTAYGPLVGLDIRF